MTLLVLRHQVLVWRDKVRTITEASLRVDETGQFLTFTFSGNGFLYKQIRNMVGTLLKIGNNRMPIEQIDLILEKKTDSWQVQLQHPMVCI